MYYWITKFTMIHKQYDYMIRKLLKDNEKSEVKILKIFYNKGTKRIRLKIVIKNDFFVLLHSF